MELIRNNKRLITLLFVISLVAASLITAVTSIQKVHAATGSMYLNPSTKTVLNGDQFTVDVRANAASANAAQVDISYPSASLDLVAYSKSGGVLPNEAQTPKTSAGNFSVVIYSGGGTNGLSTDSLLMSFTFRAKVGTGTGVIALLPSSKIVDAGSPVTITLGNSNITFTTPTPPPVLAPSITSFTASPTSVMLGGTSKLSWAVTNSTSCSVSNGGPTNTTATSWTTPNLTTVGVNSSTYTLTCKNSSGVVSVPRSLSVLVSAIPVVTPKPTPKPTAAPTPVPIKSSTDNVTANSVPTPTPRPNANTTATPTPEVKGAYTPPVALTPRVDPALGLVETTTLVLKDSSGKPLANVEVIFAGTNSKVFKSDKDGKVVVSNVPAGKLSMTIKSNGKQIATQDVTLVAGVTNTAQQVKVNSSSSSSSKTLIFVGVVGLALLLLVIAGAILFTKKRHQSKQITFNPTPTPTPAPKPKPAPISTPTISTDNLDETSATYAKVIVGNDKGPEIRPTVISPQPKDDSKKSDKS